MSHVANLRNSQRAHDLPAKKRKLSQNSTRPFVNGTNGILNDRGPSSISAVPTKDVKALKQKQTRPSDVKIVHADGDANVRPQAQDVVEISSDETESDDNDEEADDDDGDSENDEEAKRPGSTTQMPITNGVGAHSESSSEGEDGQGAEQAKVEAQRGTDSNAERQKANDEPSFGDLLRSRHGAMVDVAAQDEDDQVMTAPDAATPARAQRRDLPLRNANSLGTVLSQALRSNDTPLLESCLQVSNLGSVRATIERLPSQQAATLLQKLAERMHNRPGRAGSLMVWIQWTIVAHGGYLATQPVVMGHLQELYRVVKMRANALQPLLALKGKLDMLEAQLSLRKTRAKQSTQARDGREEGIIYIEGEESDDDSVEGAEDNDQEAAKGKAIAAAKPGLRRDLTFETDDEADDVPMVNGVAEAGVEVLESDDEAGSEDSDDEDLFDDEAEEADSDEEVLDDEVDFDDVDDRRGAADDGEAPAPKQNKKSKR